MLTRDGCAVCTRCDVRCIKPVLWWVFQADEEQFSWRRVRERSLHDERQQRQGTKALRAWTEQTGVKLRALDTQPDRVTGGGSAPLDGRNKEKATTARAFTRESNYSDKLKHSDKLPRQIFYSLKERQLMHSDVYVVLSSHIRAVYVEYL